MFSKFVEFLTLMTRRDYVQVIYSSENPFTSYPAKLTKYLAERFKIHQGDKLLDVGCGRGEFTRGFLDLGVGASAMIIGHCS